MLTPFSVVRYDFVIETGEGEFKRVQCKTGRLSSNPGAMEFNVSSNPPGGVSRTYENDVDYFGVHLAERDQVYLVPIEAVAGRRREAVLRLESPRNGQTKGIRYAASYLVNGS